MVEGKVRTSTSTVSVSVLIKSIFLQEPVYPQFLSHSQSGQELSATFEN